MKEKLPGFKACIKMMHHHSASIQEEGFHYLLPHVEATIDDLIVEFRKPENEDIQDWLLELIGYSHSEQAFAVLEEQLCSEDRRLRQWAILGLKRLGTKQAAQLLREARSYELGSPQATQELREELGPEEPWERFTRNT